MANSDIQGTATDSDGNTISNAIVALFLQENPNRAITTQADSSGNFIFEKHPDGDGTTQNWHLTCRDPNDSSRQFGSLHSVSAQLSTTIPDSGLLYDEGDGEDYWELYINEGGDGNFTKNEDHLRVESVGDSEVTGIRFGDTLDFSSYDTLEIEWLQDGDADSQGYSRFHANDTDMNGLESFSTSGTFDRRTDTLDISTVNEMGYVSVSGRETRGRYDVSLSIRVYRAILK